MEILAVAHRGDPRDHLENTVPGFLSAAAKGADMVELDVKITRDGEVVVLHDPTLERLWGVPGAVRDLAWSEVRAIEHDGYRVPSLAEILDGISLPIMVDAVALDNVDATLEVVRGRHALERCLFVTRDPATLLRLRALEATARIGLVKQARASFAVAVHAGGPTGAHARDAFVSGIHTGLLYAAGAAILAAISVAVLLKTEARNRPLAGDGAGELQQVAEVAEQPALVLVGR